MRKLRFSLALLVIVTVLSLAQAHGYVVRAIPADRSTLERPPTRLQYWFSETLEPRFSEINLRDQSGTVIATGGVENGNPSLLQLRVPAGLPNGAYIVELRPAFASDGHVIAESRVFFVGEEVGGVSGQGADQHVIPLEVIWRTLLGIGDMLFFGASIIYSVVLLPAWGSANVSGGLPPRVMRRLRNSLIFALGLCVIANLIALLQQSMVFFNVNAGQVIQQNLWQVVQIGSRFGDVWTLRMVLLIFSAALIFAADYLRDTVPQLTAGIWKGLSWLGALFVGLTMISSHAAGSLVLPWIAILMNWIHALGAATWVGGIAALALVMPVALAPYAGAERQRALRAVLMRFSRLANAIVLIVVVTGIYNAQNYFFSSADLATSYGRTLGVKLIMVGMLLGIGAWQHLALRPHLVERINRLLAGVRVAPRAERAAMRLRLESVLALLALASVAWLSATPIPEPQALQIEVDAPQATQSVGDYTVTAAILPGGPGVNTYDALIEHVDNRDIVSAVLFQKVNPESGRRSPWYEADQVDTGLYVAAGDDIDEAGDWWTLIDIIDDSGNLQRAAFAWQISESASVQQSRNPSLLHGFTLAAIMALLAALGFPTAKGLLSKLNMNAASCSLAAGAIIVSVGVMVVGAALIAERQRDYEVTLNPPPAYVNTVLPDAESLQRGEALYLESCLAWQGHSADFRALRNQLAVAGDDFFYAVVTDGWRDLSPCVGDLSAEDRWDVVNYFRTFEKSFNEN